MKKIIENISLQEISDIWPILIVWPTILGYIGFYTYASQLGISYSQVDISTIIGIGVFNIIATFLIYNPRRKEKEPRPSTVFYTVNYLNFLTINPFLILMILTIDLKIWGIRDTSKNIRNLKNSPQKTIDFSKKRRLTNRRTSCRNYFELSIFLIIFLITLFLKHNYFILFGLVFVLMKLVSYIKRLDKNKILYLLLVSLFIPFFTTVYYLNDIEYTVFGLSRENVEIKLSDDKVITSELVYSSKDFLYLHTDSANFRIPIDKVEQIKKIDKDYKGKTGLDVISNYYKDIKNWLQHNIKR